MFFISNTGGHYSLSAPQTGALFSMLCILLLATRLCILIGYVWFLLLLKQLYMQNLYTECWIFQVGKWLNYTSYSKIQSCKEALKASINWDTLFKILLVTLFLAQRVAAFFWAFKGLPLRQLQGMLCLARDTT